MMSMNKQKGSKLALWQARLAESDLAWSKEVAKMDERERLYNGERKLRPLVPGDERRDGGVKQTSHVRNIVFELVESQISSSIPQPKVTPMRKEDEDLAEVIENFLRGELDRLPFEMMNDMAERTVPIQGGVGFMVEWDNRKRTHDTIGELAVNVVHPKQFAPQPGVYTGIQDMDWFIVKVPTTKQAVRRKYGKNLDEEAEAEPEIRTVDGAEQADDALTEYIGYAQNDSGGVDRYVWVNDVELEDLENYQSRRQPVCRHCGRVRPLPGQIIDHAVPDSLGETSGMMDSQWIAGRMLAEQLAAEGMLGAGAMAQIGMAAETEAAPDRYTGGPCPWCGSEEWDTKPQEYEEILLPIHTMAGHEIPGVHLGVDAQGMAVMKPTMVPFYKPDLYPIILQRSVSEYGQLLGNSDVDCIKDQQNTHNRLEQKIIDRLIKAGTRITMPSNASLRVDPEDNDRWIIDDLKQKALIDVYDFKGNLEYEMAYLSGVYEEARQILGITDSFQGRRDATATSGKAKEFSAAQAAGRLESKRVMKNAAYAALFEMMFKFYLAYSDEPRPVVYKNTRGENVYKEFNRYDFLRQDESGSWYWNDRFLFSCDTSAPLANNREAMWQETRMNLQQGAFGDPTSTETLILFWSKMEELHYPGAGQTKKFLEERMAREQAAAQMQAEGSNMQMMANQL